MNSNYQTILSFLFLLTVIPGQAICAPLGTTPTPEKMASLQQSSKLLFTENRGQVIDDKGNHRPDILFTAQGSGTQLFLTATGIYYQFTKLTYPEGYERKHPRDLRRQATLEKQVKKETFRFSLSLGGANTHPIVRKEQKNAYTANFYTTGCPDGITNVSTYERVVYENVYPNIDWVIYSNGNHLKYDFLVHPGGDSKKIRLKIDDAQSTQITEAGELLMKTTLGEVREQAPVSYADDEQVATMFKMNADGTIGFNVRGDNGKELRIDPSVAWATYYGGGSAGLYGVANDANGDVYIAGSTGTANPIATLGGYQTTYGGGKDACIAKFDSSGNHIWDTYYGGASDDGVTFCVLDARGDLYVSGGSSSQGLATLGAYQTNFSSHASLTGSALLVKFNSNGIRKWATYYGDSDTNGNVCVADAAGNIFLAGETSSVSRIASVGAYQTTFATISSTLFGNQVGFLAKFDSLGNRVWGTYYGDENTYINAVCTDGLGNVYIGGNTNSNTNIASLGAFQTSINDTVGSGVLAKFDGSGMRQWGTYFCSSSIYGMCVDLVGNVYFTGIDAGLSTNGVATPGAFFNSVGGGILVRFNSSGNRIWGTYLGGNQGAIGYGLSADRNGHLCIAAGSRSTTGIATPGAYQTVNNGNDDGVLMFFDTSGNRLWATYFGGSDDDDLLACSMDNRGNIYAAGFSGNNGLATPGAFQSSLDNNNATSGENGIIVKFKDIIPTSTITITTPIAPTIFCDGSPISIPFTTTGTYNVPNIFTAQLSDALGSFAAPVPIGMFTATSGGTITGTIPAGTPSGTGYRIRVVSNNPTIISGDNGVDLTIIGTPVFLLGSTSVRCQGAATIVYAVSSANSGVVYSLDALTAAYPGNAINSTTGAVTYAAAWIGTTVITATANGCSTTATATHTVTTSAQPIEPAAFIASTASLCQGKSNVLYSVPSDPTVTYTWSYTGAGATIAGIGNSVIVSFSSVATSGILQVSSANSCGTSTARTQNIVVASTPTVSISGPNSICTGSTANFVAAGAASYSWSPSTTLSAGTGATVTADPAVTTTYTIIGTTNGCSDTVIKTLTVGLPSSDSIIAGPPNVFCVGTMLPLHTISDPTYQYQWQLDNANIAGATSSSYNATVGGNYDVVITTPSGCTVTSPQAFIYQISLPVPAIFPDITRLCVPAMSNDTYQWYLDGLVLPGETGTCISPVHDGSYTVTETNDAGCSVTSAVYTTDLGLGNLNLGLVNIYPNPASTIFNISAPQQVNISISSIDGRQLMYVRDAKTVDISSLPNAVYLVKVSDKDNTVIKVEKLVKTGW